MDKTVEWKGGERGEIKRQDARAKSRGERDDDGSKQKTKGKRRQPQTKDGSCAVLGSNLPTKSELDESDAE